MDKKIVVLIRAGLPYKNTILYGRHRAKDTGAKLVLVGISPALNLSRRVALSAYEFAPHNVIASRFESDAMEYLERAVQFCLDNNITAEVHRIIETEGIEGTVRKFVKDKDVQLVIVPTPTKEEHHSEFIDVVKHFAHDVLEHEIRCPVVSVIAS